VSDNRIVWSDREGDLRKKNKKRSDAPVDEKTILLKLRRLTAGKGRAIIELSDLPPNKRWCQQLAKDLKKRLAVGGTYKENKIEISGEKMDQVMSFLDGKSLKWKKTGG